uniref:Glycosyl transferase n=1 Tax=Chlorobium chlorochromatii (strain CaD3) TaxID=340177 RepID=Q3AQJ2_CHLCH
MLKILCLHIAHKQASYRYRVEQFLPYWKQYGIEFEPVCIVGKNYFEKLQLALSSNKYDYVWLQRKLLSPFFINLITKRSKLIYDYDDALYSIESQRNNKPKPTHPGSKQSIERLNYILKRASLVFAGSEALYNYSARYNASATFLIPTAFPAQSNISLPSKINNNSVTIGWIGSIQNLFFLSIIDDVTAAIQQRYPDVRFSVMSGKPPEGLKTHWDFVAWSKEGEDAWLRSIDVGIMPLVDDEWSRGKCAFKLLQYMAYGKPVIASAVGANYAAVLHGESGFLAKTLDEWRSAFEIMITNRALSFSMGQASLNHFLLHYELRHVQNKIVSLLQ